MPKKISIDNNGSDQVYLAVARSILHGHPNNTLIDLCCCNGTMTKQLGFKNKVFIDIMPRDLGEEQANFIQTDVLGNHPVFDEFYDVSICSDGIEHLSRSQGFELKQRMKSLSNLQLLFTPLDPWMMSTESDPDPEAHKSLWKPEDCPEFAHIVFPNYHPTLNIGAFFFWHCDNLDNEFDRVCSELKKNSLFKGRVSD